MKYFFVIYDWSDKFGESLLTNLGGIQTGEWYRNECSYLTIGDTLLFSHAWTPLCEACDARAHVCEAKPLGKPSLVFKIPTFVPTF